MKSDAANEIAGTEPRRNLTPEQTVGVLGLSARPANALDRMGIRTIGQLLGRSRRSLLAGKGLGASSLEEIEEALQGFGLVLGGGASAEESAPAGESFARLLQRALRPDEKECLQQAPITALPGKPGGRVRALIERTGVRTLADLTTLDPNELRRLPNVGAKTVDALKVLLEQWLRDQEEPAPEEETVVDPGFSPLLNRPLSGQELQVAAKTLMPEDGARSTLLDLLLAEPLAPTEEVAERASRRAEALLFAAQNLDCDPSEFFGHLLEAAHLTPREALVMRLRWGVGVSKQESLREVGARFKLSGEWARRLEGAMTDRLQERFARDQLRLYVYNLTRRIRWAASRWGVLSEEEFLTLLRRDFDELGVIGLENMCQRLVEQSLLDIMALAWPRDPDAGWFARSEEVLRIAQAWLQQGDSYDVDLPPKLAAWNSRVRQLIPAAAEAEEEFESELFDDAPKLAAAAEEETDSEDSSASEPQHDSDSDRDEPRHSEDEYESSIDEPEPVPTAATTEVVIESPSLPGLEPVSAPTRERRSAARARRSATADSSASPAGKNAGGTAREFVAQYLAGQGGSAPLQEIIEQAEGAGFSARRVEAVCRNLRRRFEIRDDDVVRLLH